MVHYGYKLKGLIEAKGIKTRDLAKKLNITEGNLYKIYNREHLKTDVIAQVCLILNITINDFFYEGTKENASGSISGKGHIIQSGEGDKSVSNPNNMECKKEIDYLKQIIELKDQVINDKVELIEQLKKGKEEKI